MHIYIYTVYAYIYMCVYIQYMHIYIYTVYAYIYTHCNNIYIIYTHL